MTATEVDQARRRLMHIQKQLVIVDTRRIVYASKTVEAEYSEG